MSDKPVVDSPAAHTGNDVEHHEVSTRAKLLWRIRLLVALALPVYLETLDYTGAFLNIILDETNAPNLRL